MEELKVADLCAYSPIRLACVILNFFFINYCRIELKDGFGANGRVLPHVTKRF